MEDATIRARLLIQGVSDKEITSALSTAKMEKDETTQGPRIFSSVRSYSVVALASVALIALGFAGYVMWKPPVVYSISLPGSASSTPALTYGALAALSDPDYYANVKKNLIEQNVSFIDADLSQMRLSVYKDGELALEVPILAKGKVGSWWETPAGIYQIQTKEKNHFSSFGEVYQPWSLDFQGNFFIHGWPYYEDGTQVATSYSGGCIRLSTDDAKKVYDLATVGMPVVVYNAPEPIDEFNYQLKSPQVSAAEYLVADVKNGTVLTSKGADIAAPIASISKLVSALVATEYINLDKELPVPESAIVYTSIPRLKAGTSVRAYDLLFLLLQESSNEAAETLAAARGRQAFVKYMNDKAKAINLSHTVFSDPSGAKGDYSTAEDLFTLLRYIDANRAFVFGITSGEVKNSAYGEPIFKNIQNFNVIRNTTAKLVGGKVGQTREASETYAGIFNVTVGSEKRDIAVIVLGSQDSEADVRKLLNFVQGLYAPAR